MFLPQAEILPHVVVSGRSEADDYELVTTVANHDRQLIIAKKPKSCIIVSCCCSI